MQLSTQDQLEFQRNIQSMGQTLSYIAAADPTPREVKATVRYVTALELANSIEQYALSVIFDPRDFPSGPPQKGDSVVIDGGRRAIMQVREARGSGLLTHYRCGVQG
jgi:hypothetical protein